MSEQCKQPNSYTSDPIGLLLVSDLYRYQLHYVGAFSLRPEFPNS